MFHPWRELRALGEDVYLEFCDTPGGKHAWWSPAHDTFLMRRDLLQVERRCALAHELAHRTLRHSGQCTYPDARRQNKRQERIADVWAAERLIPLDLLAKHIAWTDDPDELADDLWVTRRLLDVRLETMMGGEWVKLRSLVRKDRSP